MFNEQQLNKLYQYAYSLSKNKDNAYDLVYTCIERYLRQASPKQEEMAYLKRSIKNAFLDQIKSASHQKEVLFDDVVSGENTDSAQIGSAMDNLVGMDTSCLEDLLINEQEVTAFTEQLNSEENELLYFWAVEGYTVQELSDEIGRPRGTLLSKLHRIRKKAEQFIIRTQATNSSGKKVRNIRSSA